jgi:hypothetical protein
MISRGHAQHRPFGLLRELVSTFRNWAARPQYRPERRYMRGGK